MVDNSTALFIRPKNCQWCEQGYYAVGHMVDYMSKKGLWNTVGFQGDEAIRETVLDGMKDEGMVFGFGHGSGSTYTGDDHRWIFTTSNASLLKDRMVYLFSCLTGEYLGPEIINQGGVAFAGYGDLDKGEGVGEWKWTSNAEGGDPYNDVYACSFFDSANQLWRSLCDGKTFYDAGQDCIDKYDEHIDNWFESDDQSADTVIGLLAHDRDFLVILPEHSNAKFSTGNSGCSEQSYDETSCVESGCYWYNDDCHPTPDVPVTNPCLNAEGGITDRDMLGLAIGGMACIGLLVYAFITTKKV